MTSEGRAWLNARNIADQLWAEYLEVDILEGRESPRHGGLYRQHRDAQAEAVRCHEQWVRALVAARNEAGR